MHTKQGVRFDLGQTVATPSACKALQRNHNTGCYLTSTDHTPAPSNTPQPTKGPYPCQKTS
jgi:hypothetical protein